MDLTKEEKQLLQLCDEGTAPISEFRALIDRGVRLNIHDEEGCHPLWHVSSCGRSDLTDLFIKHGAEVDLPTADDKLGATALITASDKGHLETVKLLLHRGASVNCPQKDGNTALYFASQQNHVEVVKYLLMSGAQVNKGTITALYEASHLGRLNITKILLDHGADVNQPTDTKLRSSPLIAACDDKFVPVTQLLINHGADINYQDANGETALHFAASDGHPEIAKILLQSQANLNVRNKLGNTPLHDAVYGGHIEVVRLLLLSRANMEIKNNAGKTPLQVAEEKKHMEIVHLLKTGVPAQPAEVSVSGEAGDGEKPGEEKEPSVEPLIGELKITDDRSQLTELPKEDYVCVARNSLCLVYLPQQVNEKLSIETVTDERLYPHIASNEIIITPVVCITPDNASLSLKKPAIIELAKIIELSDKEGDNKVIPLYSKSSYSGWNQLGTESVVNCKVLQDRISFQVTHFSLYAVISRKPYPTSSVRVKPASATAPPTPDHSSNTHTQLTIPELPGFKVQIPPSSVNSPDKEETDITATVLYDCPAVCSEDERSRLASSCIKLEPHGTTFTKKVSVSIPIPHYAEIRESHPNAKLQVWHSNNKAKFNVDDRHTLSDSSWTLVEHSMHQDDDGQYTAVILVNQFSIFRSMWDTFVYIFSPGSCTEVKSIKARCQVFMSQEVSVNSFTTFSIAVLYCPYDREPVLNHYKYELAESGLLDLKVAQDNKLYFQIELSRILECTRSVFSGKFDITGRQRKEFPVELGRNVELKENLPIGQLSLGRQEGSEDSDHTLMLIKPVDEMSEKASSKEATSPSTPSAYRFEESIVAIEVAAEKLDEDASRCDKENQGAMVEAAKKIASMWTEMAQLLRKECVLKERRFKEDIVDLAKSISNESQGVTRIAGRTAEACTDRIMKNAVNGVAERMQMISHQLRILAAGEASRQRDEAADLEACQLLTANAKNLTSAISDALYHTQSASIRVAKTTREELGLTQLNVEALSITGKPSHMVRDDRSREGDHYQDSHESSRGHSSQVDLEERSATRLSGSDYTDIYYKLEGHAARWRDIGRALRFTEGEMDNIEGRPFLMRLAPNSWLGEMLTQWLEWAPGDGRGSVGFATKEVLRAALLKANLGQLAQQFQ